MTIVSVQEQFQPSRYLIVSNRSDSETIVTTRVIVSDLRTNTINLVTIEKGPEGIPGAQGPKGDPGKDGLVFDVLPVSSGGTSNTIFSSGYLLTYDGEKISSASYTVDDIINLSSANANSITGIIAGTGLQKSNGVGNTVILDVKIGDGLKIDNQTIVVDDTIPRTSSLNLNQLNGVLPISKGGSNNSLYSSNKLIYYNGSQFTSFPVDTGNIVISGAHINIIAGSGLVGGGLTTIPNGSILLQIGESADIIVEENSISLSNTGIAGTYNKITTDDKGRVVSGSLLTTEDIISLLGYAPWHPGNDGEFSGLDADLLDGQHGSFYRNSQNLSGVVSLDRLPDLHSEAVIGTKFRINTKGLIEESYLANAQDIISSLGYRPVDAENSDTKNGNLTLNGDFTMNAGNVSLYDNLPLFGTNRPDILPSDPRGFTFNYGGSFINKTGILAYYPTDNQLKLITNIFASGSNIDGNTPNQDDINGGTAESIYIIENLQGEALTVLFREVADQLYITTNNTQNIFGLKRFLAELEVAQQIRILGDGNPATKPPIVVGDNNLLVNNLNADLLDNQHGTFYRNAANITGSFNYNNVSFDHIAGENQYIAKFDDPANPSRRITSSNILQRPEGDIEVSNAVNLIIGESDNVVNPAALNTVVVGENNETSSENSLVVGIGNRLEGFNSLVVGQNNIASGINSVATNLGSITSGPQSVAMGSYGLSRLENQFSFGAFRTTANSGTQVLEHGQYSTIAAYLRGTETNGNWTSMTPTIQLPQDKTIAYNIEVLINKGLSSGVGHFVFNSGIINNATYRNPLNITEILNTTTVPNTGTKIEIFNNSQLRRHYHFWNYTHRIDSAQTNRVAQYINCLDTPVRNIDLSIRNVSGTYFYLPEKVKTTGIFTKRFDGQLILDIDKPRYDATFSQSLDSPNILIYSRNHGAVTSAEIDIRPLSSSRYALPIRRYKAMGIVDSDHFFVESPMWTGVKTTSGNKAVIQIHNTSNYDKQFSFDFTAPIYANTISISSEYTNSYGHTLKSIVKPDTTVKLIRNNITGYYRTIQSINSNQLILNFPIYTSGISPQPINEEIRVIIDNYSYDIYKTADRIYVNTDFYGINGDKTESAARFFPDARFRFVNDGGSGTNIAPSQAMLYNYQNSGIFLGNDVYEQPSFKIVLSSTITSLADGSTVSVRPVFSNNTGSIDLYHRDTYECRYSSSYSELNKHSGCYIRWKDKSNYHRITIFDSGNKPINFISNPPSFSLVDGYLSEYNDAFRVVQSGNRYYLYSADTIDYETNNIIPVRIKASPYKPGITNDLEKILYVYIDDVQENPIVINPVPNTGIVTDSLFLLNVSSGIFNDPDGDSLHYTAEIKGGHPLPRWLSFDTLNGVFSGVPDICDIGAYSIDIIATDISGLQNRDNFIIQVSENLSQALEGFAFNINSILSTQDIYLTNNTIKENSPPNTLIGEIKHLGGYNPYISFLTAENTFSGYYTSNSDLIRYCKPNIQNYIPATISGSPEYLSVDSKITIKNLNQENLQSSYVKNIYKPTIFSGTALNNDKIILSDISIDYSDSTLFINQHLPTSKINHAFGSNLRVKFFDDYSIQLADYLLQEVSIDESSLILTEDNMPIRHDILAPKISHYIEDHLENDLATETYLDKLIYDSPYNQNKNVVWSRKNLRSYLYNESLTFKLASEVDTLISDNYSNLEYISYDPTYIDIDLMTENAENLVDDVSDHLAGRVVDDIWYSDTPIKIYRQNHPGVSSAPTFIYPNNTLDTLYYDPATVALVESNIDYVRPAIDLYNAHDHWIFDKSLNNAVLYVNELGSDDLAHFVTENRALSGLYLSDIPFEYGILIAENGDGLISDTKTDHGSRIESSRRYEILESQNIFSDNGKLSSELFFENLLCENNDLLVHDYAISAQKGSAYLLFPGDTSEIKLIYPKKLSFSSARLSNGLTSYYEDNLLYLPSSLKFTEPNFYYSWGKLIPHRLYTDEYVIRLYDQYAHSSMTGLVVYSGDIPDSGHYFPEIFQDHIFTRYSGVCPAPYSSGGINGFGIKENYNSIGEYVTGLVTFYTDVTSNKIDVVSIDNEFNLDSRNTDYLRLYNPSTNAINPQLPRVGTYLDIENKNKNLFSVENFFLFPSIFNVNHTGSITVNLDRNHGKKSLNPKINNRIAIDFDSIYGSNQNRLPKNNYFEIQSISGNKIYTVDNKNYLLKETNRPDYFDHPIKAKYITNGCEFLGSLFHDHTTIYDVRPNLHIFNQVYNNITFEFDKNKQELSINIPTGIIRIFDRIELYDFAPLSPYMIWNNNQTYNTGFLVAEHNLSVRNKDDSPDKDFVLMERSATVLQPENAERLTFKTDIFANSVSGTCVMSNKLANRLHPGYHIDYDNNTNELGHSLISIQDGYSFSGFIPRNHNILSSNGIINDSRIGFSSIVSTGVPFLNGIRTEEFVGMNDIGYTEYYKIHTTGFTNNDALSYTINGNGSPHLPYKIFIDTTGSNTNTRFIEFLYLGHNSNTINFSGMLSTSGNADLTISHINLADQLYIEYLAKLGVVSGVVPVVTTGTNGIPRPMNYSISVNRFDIIQLRLKDSLNDYNNFSYLYSFASSVASPLPLKLLHNSIINTEAAYYPSYQHSQHRFYVLPSIQTNNKYCNNNSVYAKNNTLFYNGNLIQLSNLDSIKSFLNKYDQIKLLQLNNNKVIDGDNIYKINSSNETTFITGITLNGPTDIVASGYQYFLPQLLENTNRHSIPISTGLHKYTVSSGYADFAGFNSGAFSVLDNNNILIQSHGGSTARWPQDTDGKLVSPPLTGTYSISNDINSPCSSGRLCVIISGYKNSNFNSLLFDKYYYFDFADGLPSLSNSYKLKDKLSLEAISIDIPQNISYVGQSGLVYIIDSNFNIKSNLNPNENNIFVNNAATINNNSLIQNIIHAFDNDTKKWNHLFHLYRDLPVYSSYPVNFSAGTSSAASQIVYYPEQAISVTDISILSDPVAGIFAPLYNNIVSTYTDSSSLILRVRTSGGSPPLQNTVVNIPKIFLSGVGEYRTITNNPLFDYRPGSGWDVGIEIIPFKNTGVFPVKLLAVDETGSDDFNFDLIIKEKPSISVTYPTGYCSITSPYWKLYFDVAGIDLLTNNPGGIGLYVSGSPNDLSYELIRRSSSELELVGYPAGGGFSTGIWNPVVKILDLQSGNVAASGSGTLHVLNSLNDRPLYEPYISNFTSNRYINLAKFEKISFNIPVYEIDQDHASIITNLNGGIYFDHIRTAATYDPNMNRFIVEYTPTNTGSESYLTDTSYANSRPFNYSISQPNYVNGNKLWNTYTSNNYLTNFTFYRPIYIDTTFINTIPEFNTNEPWSFEFLIQEGATKHRPDLKPRVTLFNTPGLGSSTQQYLSYALSYRYDATNKQWIVTAKGKPDIYGRYTTSTGIHTINIFADDLYTSTYQGAFSIKYIEGNSIDYITPNLYTTPNNEYFLQADVKERYSDDYPQITFDGENTLSINYNDMHKKYNKTLGIWEVAGTGNKLINKWDARILIDASSSPSITLQCKGIATDKITAVAKVNLLELQNTNRDIVIDQARPIKITGVQNLTVPESGIIVEQGANPWMLKFKTVFGLQSPLNPPTIILENTPTFCTGYDPRLDPLYSDATDPSLQNSCLSTVSFDPGDKSWNFAFSGLPSCTLLGPQAFTITAIDTNLLLPNPYIEPSDSFDSLFTYIPISEPHPKPKVIELGQDVEPLTFTELKPFCNTLYYLKLKFGPEFRVACPQPTGLTGIFISGSLPSGLTYTINYPSFVQGNPFNAPIYNNLQSGEIIIQGYPTAFARQGNKYDEEFGVIVVDARNQSGSKVVSFTQNVQINDPNVGLKVYFESDKPVFTPSSGLNIIPNSTLYVYRPEAAAYELQCYSSLPDNKCPSRIVRYSGLPEQDNYLFIIPFEDDPVDNLFVNNQVYIRINQDNNNINNGTYFLKKSSQTTLPQAPPNLWYIETIESTFSPRTGLADIVVANHIPINLQNFATLFNGDIQQNYGCLLGNGLIDTSQSSISNILGIRGYISPGYSGQIPVGRAFAPNDVRLTGLQFTNIDSNNTYAQIPYTNCWETGYLRVSGVILPKIFIEITDPPPALGSNFSVNGSTFALNSRLSFGDSELERVNPVNWRAGSAAYKLYNLYNDTLIMSGTIPITISSQQSIALNASLLAGAAGSTGTVFRLDMEAPGDTFPTYNVQARPRAQGSNYFWSHKATTTQWDIPSQSSFAPVIPCLPDVISVVSGVLINYNNNTDAESYGIDGLAYGGYIPHNICYNNICPPGYSNDPYFLSNGQQWSAKNYLPLISGIILENAHTTEDIVLNGVFNLASKTATITNNNILITGNLVQFDISRQEWNGTFTPIDSFITGLLPNNFVNNNLIFDNKEYGFSNTVNLKAYVKFITKITDIDTNNNQIFIKHNGLNLQINDLISLNSNSKSTTLNSMEHPGSVSVLSISNTGLIVSASSGLYQNFNIDDNVDIYKIIEDNIKTMAYNISSENEGIYNFIISGRANILYGKYLYRIMTKENATMPIFVNTDITPKAYEKDITMYVSKPIHILSASVVWPNSSNTWSVQLQIEGGRLPALSEVIDVKVDLDGLGYSYCGFNRFPAGTDKDIFNSSTNITTISLSSSNRVNWSAQSAFTIRVSDSTGSDTIIIQKG